MNWRTKHKITMLVYALIIGCVPTGVTIAIGKVWWEVYTAPLLGLTLEELFVRPFIDTLLGLGWFFIIPEAAVVCVILIVISFGIFAEKVL